jgi:hypothetical protein
MDELNYLHVTCTRTLHTVGVVARHRYRAAAPRASAVDFGRRTSWLYRRARGPLSRTKLDPSTL